MKLYFPKMTMTQFRKSPETRKLRVRTGGRLVENHYAERKVKARFHPKRSRSDSYSINVTPRN